MPDRLIGIAVGGDGGEAWDSQRILLAGWVAEVHPRLLAFAKGHLMRALSPHFEAEDVLQDAIVRVWKNPENTQRLNGVQAFERWMKRVILNRVLDLRRMLGVRDKVWPAGVSGGEAESDEWDQLDRIPSRSSAGDAAGLTARQGCGDGVARELGFLRFEEHICVLMRDVMEMDWRSVAAALRRSTNGAKSLRHRARGRFL